MNVQDEARAVWYAARSAGGEQPDPDRVERVREKLADADGLIVVVMSSSDVGEVVVGMALAEAFRDRQGAGELVAGHGHVSMVFVHPEHQGRGVGRELMESLIAQAPWPRLSLWTRDANTAAQRLYAAVGFTRTADSGQAPDGASAHRWAR